MKTEQLERAIKARDLLQSIAKTHRTITTVDVSFDCGGVADLELISDETWTAAERAARDIFRSDLETQYATAAKELSGLFGITDVPAIDGWVTPKEAKT